MIYTRKKKGVSEEIECDDLEDAKNAAITDWATGRYIPQHIKDSNGNEVIGHTDLREFLLDKTGIAKWTPS